MKSTPYLHLAWKEYRAVRLFWVAIVGLTIVGDIVATNLTNSPALRTTWIFNLAFVPPVLFALGSAAASFSGEQEEGTFEFLRIAPISSHQILASKLAVAALGTAAMFILLWPLAQWFNHSQLPGDVQLHNMLGLWLVAALEAIAWGTLFSLVTARPMLAVILAMTAASSAAHFFAWRTRLTQNFGFEFASYLRAVPWRIVAALVVLGVDIALGRHWLEGTGNATKGLRTWSRRKTRVGAEETDASSALAGSMMFQPDRSQMLGHLLWQHWRQSKWLMIILVGLQIALFEVIGGVIGGLLGDSLRQSDFAVIGPLAAFAALMGTCVFLSDQERRHFRFFIEHNVPARYVWITRQLPWMAMLLVATIFTCWRLLTHSDFDQLWRLIQSLTDTRQIGRRANQFGDFQYLSYHFPKFAVYLSCIAVSYCAGQWASMMIRSGIMAGFVGLILSGLLCGWVFLMQLLDLSWLWTIAPIPLVLLWATWLRAPDWARENTTWSARRRAALAVVVPAAVLCTMIGYYRVEQIHLMSPGFDVAAFEAETTRDDAFATGELYRRAAMAYVHPKEDLEADRPMTDVQREFLKQNSESLALELQASQRPSCAFAGGLTFPLTWLIGLSGHELEADGKLDEALDRYISSLHVALHFGGDTYLKWAFQEIADWGAVKGQTPERLRLAIQKLEALKDADQSFERAIKNQYIQERRWTEGGKSDDFFPRTNQSLATAATIDMIMPWERWRGVRALNVVTADVLNQLQLVQMKLNSQEVSYPNMATVHLLPPTAGPDSWWWVSPGDIGKFESTFPSPEPMSNFGSTIARDLVEFEALRRGTMIVLALQAYRLEHGELPDSLEKLARGPHNNWKPPAIGTKGGAFFNTVLLDPYSGEPFRYFPRGLPEFPKQSDVLSANPDWTSEFDSTLSNIAQAWQQKSIVAGMPGIWSTGPDLIGKWVDEQMYDPDTMENVKSTPHLYYWSRWPGGEQGSLPNYAAWPKGIWFPIPERKEMMEGKDR